MRSMSLQILFCVYAILSITSVVAGRTKISDEDVMTGPSDNGDMTSRLRDVEEELRQLKNVVEALVIEQGKLKNTVKKLKASGQKCKNELSKCKTDMSNLASKDIESGHQSFTDLAKDYNVSQVNTSLRGRRQLAPPAAFSSRPSRNFANVYDYQWLIFDEVLINIGNEYDPSSGVFTCSKAGIYVFFVNILSFPQKFLHATLIKNGQSVMSIYSDSTSSGHSNNGSNMIILMLSQGDRVYLLVRGGEHAQGTLADSKFTTFSGFLLH